MTLRTRYLERPGATPLLALESADGWAEVGSAAENGRRPHWFAFEGLAVATRQRGGRLYPHPFLTLGQARETMVTGRYREVRRHDKQRLRIPDEVIGPRAAEREEPIRGLTWHEADTFCHLAGGRLPTEKELDLLVRHLAAELDLDFPVALRSASRWSPWSYAWCSYDPASGRWREARDRVHAKSDRRRSVLDVEAGLRVTRRAVDIGESDTALTTWVVFDVQMVPEE